MDCEGVPVSDDSISFAQCCFGLSAVSFALPGQCSLCPTPSASKFSIIVYLTSSSMTYIRPSTLVFGVVSLAMPPVCMAMEILSGMLG